MENLEIISKNQFLRCVSVLPTRDKVTRDEIAKSIMTDQGYKTVKFKWNNNIKQWIILNPIGCNPGDGKERNIACRKCGNMEHIINKETTKVKCTGCGLITNVKLI